MKEEGEGGRSPPTKSGEKETPAALPNVPPATD